MKKKKVLQNLKNKQNTKPKVQKPQNTPKIDEKTNSGVNAKTVGIVGLIAIGIIIISL